MSDEWLDHDQTRVRLLAAPGDGPSGEELRLGLQFELEPGWKIYWRTPGQAGITPELDWYGSDNLAAAEIRWSVPHCFAERLKADRRVDIVTQDSLFFSKTSRNAGSRGLR